MAASEHAPAHRDLVFGHVDPPGEAVLVGDVDLRDGLQTFVLPPAAGVEDQREEEDQEALEDAVGEARRLREEEAISFYAGEDTKEDEEKGWIVARPPFSVLQPL